jgi:hypothetical protein
MMPTGLKPWTKYIEPILALASPKIHKQLHSFIGRVIFYRTMLYHRAHVMATLTKLTKVEHSKFKQNWGSEQDEAFAQIKALISQDVIPRYPDPNLPFDIISLTLSSNKAVFPLPSSVAC